MKEINETKPIDYNANMQEYVHKWIKIKTTKITIEEIVDLADDNNVYVDIETKGGKYIIVAKGDKDEVKDFKKEIKNK